MSTLTDQRAAREAAEKAKAKKKTSKKKPKIKTKAKRDDAGRFVKDEADLDTPSM